PARARGPKQYVLAELPPARAKWFQENVLDEFNDEHGANLELKVPDKEGLFDALAHADASIVAAIAPKTMATLALERGAVRSFEAAFDRVTLDHAFEDLRPEAMQAAQRGDKQAFLPRASTVTISLYRVSRVRDAVLNWQAARPAIDAALRPVNGRG